MALCLAGNIWYNSFRHKPTNKGIEMQEYIRNKDAEFVETLLSAKEQMSPCDRAKVFP